MTEVGISVKFGQILKKIDLGFLGQGPIKVVP